MRKLTLKRETVAELRAAELDSIVGAAGVTKQTQCYCSDFAPCYPTYDCTLDDCFETLIGC